MITTQGSQTGSSIKILLIEDNDISRQLMTDFLTDCGYDVLALAEASRFASVVAEFAPNLILLDLKLPNVDGFTLLQRLQVHPDWQAIPVIVISAYAYNTDKQRALTLGARRYLVKPVRLTELMDAILAETACLASCGPVAINEYHQ
ncbi:MAG: response regulator [Leptolyngbyaceae cyanobacterium bins.349]|nr:response regulator [Leptolyngbyaceae cyanobacterium bins.349]